MTLLKDKFYRGYPISSPLDVFYFKIINWHHYCYDSVAELEVLTDVPTWSKKQMLSHSTLLSNNYHIEEVDRLEWIAAILEYS